MSTNFPKSRHSPAWYYGSREEFLSSTRDEIANQLAGRAVDENLQVESSQTEEWRQSVDILQKTLDDRIPILRDALLAPGCNGIRYVVLEFDFRRRGLRMDCLLIGEGVLFVIEFKRSRIQRSDRDQVMNYAVNLLEFHRATQDWCHDELAIVVPVLALTAGSAPTTPSWPGLSSSNWPSLVVKPLECDKATFKEGLLLGLSKRRSNKIIPLLSWLNSSFRPSSSILDATLSLYGNHDVAAIQDHAAPQEAIEASIKEIKERIDDVFTRGEYHLIFLSGSPGAGKTLVGLDIVMRGAHTDGSVFVTGNAPLVDVLNKALSTSYKAKGRNKSSWTPTGYQRSDAKLVASAASFKIVKAHSFLGTRGTNHRQEDGRLLVFDEAQRTYEMGRMVLGVPLEDHEADLVLKGQRVSYPKGGAVVVALIGHNQAINRGERGIIAWLEAAERLGWSFSISDETLALAEFKDSSKWAEHPARRNLAHGHLHQSMRYYRNASLEEWVNALLAGDFEAARKLATTMSDHGSAVWITRSLSVAKAWAKSQIIGGHRAGIIASGQARRLAAEGLFVDYKPDIATWMLAPSSDIRSSNALETVQNQYQIQGLELDFCLVCWDADLRREGNTWASYRLSGTDWQRDKLIDVALNGYRVLLTRSRKGMVIFVPMGDLSGEDTTRNIRFYEGTWEYLKSCGAVELSAKSL